MSIIKSILRRFGRDTLEGEIEEQLQFHIEMRTSDNIGAGMTREEAEADALRRFGDLGQVLAECREITHERASVMNQAAIKAITWVMLGCGLTLSLIGEVVSLQQVGKVGHQLIWIAILWRLLTYLRAKMPDRDRVDQLSRIAQLSSLNLTSPASAPGNSSGETPDARITVHDEKGRTPVERLLASDE